MSQAELQGVLDSLSLDQLKALQSGNYEGIPAEALQKIQGLTSQSGQNLQPQQAAQDAPPGVPSQRLRSMAQGLTVGGADEMEAYVRSLAGEPYKAAETDVRQKLKAYQQASPYESLAYEAGGAVLPALAMTRATGGTAAPATAFAPLLARAAGVGALQGGATGFATGEGDIFERLSRIPQGMAVGGIAAPVGTALLSGGGALANKLVDFARRSFGNRGSKAVETEVQRLATESGLTTDEIVQRVANGEIMAENATLQAAVRGLYTKGGEAATTIRGALTQRPPALRSQAVEQMRKGLAPSGDANILRQQKMNEADIKLAEKALYGAAFAEGGVVNAPMLDAFSSALKRAPTAAKDINDLYVASTGKKPFFSFKDGDIEYSRTPTLEDMEIVRRGIQDEVNKAYTKGAGGVGGALKDVELQLRGELDKSSQSLAAARQTASQTRTASESFQEGRKAFSKSADQVSVEFESMTPAAQKAYRSGLMDAIRNKMTTGSRKSMMGNFADETSKEGSILRSVFQQDQLPELLKSVQTAAGSQRAATRIIGGSDTAASMQESKRVGMNISAEEVTQAVGGDPIAGYRVLKKFIFKNAGSLSETERDQVARILVATDPKLVRSALVDESAMAQLQETIRRMAYRTSVGVPGGVTQIGAGRVQPSQEKR
jgi:hypothetical protein